MPTLKLTAAAVKNLKAPLKGRVEYWDSQLPGFGLRVSHKGGKVWQAFYRVDGKMVREKIGTLAQIPDVADARQKARDSMTAASAGTNPVVQKRQEKAEQKAAAMAEEERKANTLAGTIGRYMAERPKVNRKGKALAREYLDEINRCLTRDVISSSLGMKPIAEIEAKDIRTLVRDISRTRPAHANHVLAYVRTALAWAVEEDIMAINVAAAVKPPAPRVERDRALEDWEIKLFWQACDQVGWPFGPLDKLLLLTGQRRDELAQATWSEFDLDNAQWTLPASRSKNGASHIVHLSQLALDILGALPRVASPKAYLFTTDRRATDTPISGFSASARRIKAAMQKLADAEGLPEVRNYTRHDLRRSAATNMAALGIPPHVIDKVLNHSTGKISGVAAVYNRFEYLEDRKAALDAWADHITKLTQPPAPVTMPSNVVELAAARA
jgi:integrase